MQPEAVEPFRCLNCGYLLTGLSGDPLVCPECGERNAVAELESYRSVDPGAFETLQSAPAIAAGGIVLALLGLLLVTQDWLALLLVPIGVTLWGIGANRFGRATGGGRAARAVFRAFVWLTVVLLVAVGGGLYGFTTLVGFSVRCDTGGYLPRVAGIALAVGAVLVIRSFAPFAILRRWSRLFEKVVAAQRRPVEKPQRQENVGDEGRESGRE
jgi:hypothetical protein